MMSRNLINPNAPRSIREISVDDTVGRARLRVAARLAETTIVRTEVDGVEVIGRAIDVAELLRLSKLRTSPAPVRPRCRFA